MLGIAQRGYALNARDRIAASLQRLPYALPRGFLLSPPTETVLQISAQMAKAQADWPDLDKVIPYPKYTSKSV